MNPLNALNPSNLWQPNCSIDALQARAQMLFDIRLFFKERGVLEVETPLLCAHAATHPHLQAVAVPRNNAFSNTDLRNTELRSTLSSPDTLKQAVKPYYLQTSPEFAMKRLLAAGSGSIYQICKAFRQGEQGSRHNPEFTMLEWYRLDFDHFQLMDEVDTFLQIILGTEPALRLSYQDLFLRYVNFDPHHVSIEELKSLAVKHQINLHFNLLDNCHSSSLSVQQSSSSLSSTSPSSSHEFLTSVSSSLSDSYYASSPFNASSGSLSKTSLSSNMNSESLSKDDWLDLFMTHCIEPELKKIGKKIPVMIFHYPESQAALAKVRHATDNTAPPVAERFEVYVNGLELANGYHELQDPNIQRQRFKEDNEQRLANRLPLMEPDLRLIQALETGFPACAGVALGIDRLLMLKENYSNLQEAISFTFERA